MSQPGGAAVTHGIFFTHRRNPRIRQHFRRLGRQSAGLVEWHFVFNPDSGARPEAPFEYDDPADVMPLRYQAMQRNGGVQGGYLDTALIPCLRALDADYTWVMEYDVDWAGRWDRFFTRFADNEADLLTTSLARRADFPEWAHWEQAAAPAWVPEEAHARGLHPMMRVSRSLVSDYVEAMSDKAWQGHYEFTLTTLALARGARVEDLGGDGPFTPLDRRDTVYVGRSADPDVEPTFAFRPVRRSYFHEDHDAFARRAMLYHPVKPGVRAWSKRRKNLRPPDPD